MYPAIVQEDRALPRSERLPLRSRAAIIVISAITAWGIVIAVGIGIARLIGA